MSLDSLIQFLLSFIDLFRFWVVVDPDEAGLVLRMGKLDRRLGPGDWYLKWPLGIERERLIKTAPDTLNLAAQALTTRDGLEITVAVIVKFRVVDAVKALLEVQDRENTVRDCVLGEVCWLVQRYDWEEVRAAKFHRKLTRAARRHGSPSGLDILSVKFTDCTTTLNVTSMQVG